MRKVVQALCLAAAAGLMAGCATQGPHHEAWVCRPGREDCSNSSASTQLENKYWRQIDHNTEYTLGFVEFDDQGMMLEPQQAKILFEELEQEAAKQDLSVLIYIHGWKHNAANDDLDVRNFRWLLRGLYLAEQARLVQSWRKRRVVGIYLGWPGSSLALPFSDTLPVADVPQNLTFWTRMAAARRVADGDIGEVLALAEDLQSTRNKQDMRGCPRSMRLVLIGHSFGGLIAYNAVKGELIRTSTAAAGRESEPVHAYGDLVVLVNPAFEGVSFEPVHRILNGRKDYNENQQPVLVEFTSQSDWATGYAFPFGRSLGTLLERSTSGEQADAIRQAVGHVQRFRTHELTLAQPDPDIPRTYLLPENLQRTKEEKERQEAEAFERKFRVESGWNRTYTAGATLHQIGPSPAKPVWMVTVSPDIISGHNGIWGYEFTDFMRQVYTDVARQRESGCKDDGEPGAAQAGLDSPTTPAALMPPAAKQAALLAKVSGS